MVCDADVVDVLDVALIVEVGVVTEQNVQSAHLYQVHFISKEVVCWEQKLAHMTDDVVVTVVV